jgi:hypothetical protein
MRLKLPSRYARTDEIAIPFGITVDFGTTGRVDEAKGINIPKDSKATLRERDSMQQIRVPLDELPALVRQVGGLTRPTCPWSRCPHPHVCTHGRFGEFCPPSTRLLATHVLPPHPRSLLPMHAHASNICRPTCVLDQ